MTFIFSPVTKSFFNVNEVPYIFLGGYTTNDMSLWRYSGTVLQLASFGAAQPMNSASAAVVGTAAFIFGASDNNNRIMRMTNSSSATESVTVVGRRETTACSISSNAFVFGGESINRGLSGPSQDTNSIHRYTGVAFSTDISLLAARATKASSANILGNAFIFGGEILNASPTVTAVVTTIQKYTGSTITTESEVIDQAGARGASCCVISSIAYVFGGGVEVGPFVTNRLSSNIIQRYDGITRTTDAATLSDGANDSGASTISNNAFVVGRRVIGATRFNGSIQRYDGSTRTTDRLFGAGDTTFNEKTVAWSLQAAIGLQAI